MTEQVLPYINGVPLSSIAPFGEVTWSHNERGCGEMGFTIGRPKGWRDSRLLGQPRMDLKIGLETVCTGELVEPDWSEMRFTANGAAAKAEDFQALAAGPVATSTLSAALDYAIALGFDVTYDYSVPTTAHTTTADDLNSIGALADSIADEQGTWWTIRADRVFRFETQKSTVDWQLVPGVVDLSNATDDYCSALVVAYKTAGGSVARTIVQDDQAVLRFGYKQGPWDLTPMGPMTLTRAQDIASAVLAKGRSRMGWTSTIEVTADQLLTAGGRPAVLSMVRSLQTLRIPLYGHVAELYGQTYLDCMIGQTNHTAGGKTIQIAPVGKVASTFAEVQEQTIRLAMGRAA